MTYFVSMTTGWEVICLLDTAHRYLPLLSCSSCVMKAPAKHTASQQKGERAAGTTSRADNLNSVNRKTLYYLMMHHLHLGVAEEVDGQQVLDPQRRTCTRDTKGGRHKYTSVEARNGFQVKGVHE